MSRSWRSRMFLVGVVTLTFAVFPAVAQEAPKRSITEIGENLYRFQNNFHFSVFLVTDDGIIATDPINAEAATWLKEQLNERFGKPVKYLIYSHDHADHIAGGEVFADTATVIAHENARTTILGENRPTAVPDLTFSDRMTLELGGQHVELIYVGRGHSDNSIVMRFPSQRVLFAVDFISIKRLPYRDLSDSYFPDWIDAVRLVEGLDFDVLAPGHGFLGSREDVVEHRRYLEALHEAVLAANRAGQSLDEMKGNIKLGQFSHLGRYDEWLPLNIEGIHRRVVLQRRGN